MGRIIAIRSAIGSYFEVGKNSDGYYLKNRYTEIPNEFNYYDPEAAKTFFDKLCEQMPYCEEVILPSGHPNSCMYVIYFDGTVRLLKKEDCIGGNICACTAGAALYSEFFQSILETSELLTLEHLRQVCHEGKEDFSYFLKTVKDLKEDDGIRIFLGRPRNGETVIIEDVLGYRTDPYITISEDGIIGETGGLKFVELLKKHGVRIVNETVRFKG